MGRGGARLWKDSLPIGISRVPSVAGEFLICERFLIVQTKVIKGAQREVQLMGWYRGCLHRSSMLLKVSITPEMCDVPCIAIYPLSF